MKRSSPHAATIAYLGDSHVQAVLTALDGLAEGRLSKHARRLRVIGATSSLAQAARQVAAAPEPVAHVAAVEPRNAQPEARRRRLNDPRVRAFLHAGLEAFRQPHAARVFPSGLTQRLEELIAATRDGGGSQGERAGPHDLPAYRARTNRLSDRRLGDFGDQSPGRHAEQVAHW